MEYSSDIPVLLQLIFCCSISAVAMISYMRETTTGQVPLPRTQEPERHRAHHAELRKVSPGQGRCRRQTVPTQAGSRRLRGRREGEKKKENIFSLLCTFP